MNLISNKSSWNTLSKVFQDFYDDSSLKVNFSNFKRTFFEQDYPIKTLYFDTCKKGNNGPYLTMLYEKEDVTIVLNNTVTDIDPTGLFRTGSYSLNWKLVFKHNSTELNNINFIANSILMYSIFATFTYVIVPEGTKNDYVTFFSSFGGWESSYVDRIIEGDEFTEIEEVSSNAVS